jgi:hypothetical protein
VLCISLDEWEVEGWRGSSGGVALSRIENGECCFLLKKLGAMIWMERGSSVYGRSY